MTMTFTEECFRTCVCIALVCLHHIKQIAFIIETYLCRACRRMYHTYVCYFKQCVFIHRGIRITTNKPDIRPLFETICLAPKFMNWLDLFQLDLFDLRTITLTDVDFFGAKPSPENLGFLKFKCEVYTKMGDQIDGIVFLRGDCGAVLIIVTDENDKQYVLLTEQPRIPTGGYKEEIVAGMFDHRLGATVVNGLMKKEILEETGLLIEENSEEFIPLGAFTLSGGGCDENVHLAFWSTRIESNVIETMKQKQYGEKGSREKIRLKFYPVDEDFEERVLPRIADAKTSLAWYAYKNLATYST